MDSLAFLLERRVIITLAIAGALIATAGSLMVRGGTPGRTARLILRAGYVVTFASILLFIVAGFLSGR